MQSPIFLDVLRAKQNIAPYLPRTPLFKYPALDAAAGLNLYVKHENYQPIGAFKVRGGINLISQLSDDEKTRGVISASTGNHGQSIAYAARIFNVPATIVVPENANPVKVDAMRALGATIVFHGPDFDAAREYCEMLAEEKHLRYVHSGNEPLLIAGVGTHTLEILEDEPDIDVVIVPIGGGSGAAGACIVAKALNPKIRVIGVQAENAPAAYKSWKARAMLEDTNATFAEGLATRTAFALPQKILWDMLDDFILVSEEAMRAAIVMYLQKAKTLSEGAGASSLAGALQLREQLNGRKVALILSGGNITPEQLKMVLA
ncbi:MAG: threonine/serine dehydratase [Chloroflexota bacterium]|nr:MAG: threonine/serine dehydratase [Chloroflexota bacterium]